QYQRTIRPGLYMDGPESIVCKVPAERACSRSSVRCGAKIEVHHFEGGGEHAFRAGQGTQLVDAVLAKAKDQGTVGGTEEEVDMFRLVGDQDDFQPRVR